MGAASDARGRRGKALSRHRRKRSIYLALREGRQMIEPVRHSHPGANALVSTRWAAALLACASLFIAGFAQQSDAAAAENAASTELKPKGRIRLLGAE